MTFINFKVYRVSPIIITILLNNLFSFLFTLKVIFFSSVLLSVAYKSLQNVCGIINVTNFDTKLNMNIIINQLNGG